jgi:hypothetical protein
MVRLSSAGAMPQRSPGPIAAQPAPRWSHTGADVDNGGLSVKLEPLYRMRFTYPEGWEVPLGASGSFEGQYFFLAEGRCEGRIEGTLRASNHPRRRGDGTFEPNLQGVIETTDGATIFHDCRGYGRPFPAGRRQIVVTAFHLSDHPNYRWLNMTLAVGVGEVRSREGGQTELVIDWSELIWEPLTE